MKALIVYDSIFGNTEKVAQAVAQALGAQHDVKVMRVGDVTSALVTGLHLLIVGSPTRGFRMTPATRKFLDSLPSNSLKGVKVAAFDTRIALSDVNSGILNVMVRLFGYAAKPIADQLTRKGGSLYVAPEGFFVKASEGPLTEGELDRAARWAGSIIAAQ